MQLVVLCVALHIQPITGIKLKHFYSEAIWVIPCQFITTFEITMVERLFMVRWVIGSILHGGSIELFFIPASAPRLVQQRPWYVLYCLCDGAYKIILAANWKE